MMKIVDLKRRLKDSTKEQLEKDILDLYKKSNFVKEYYTSKNSDGGELSLLKKHQQIIEQEFFPVRGFGDGRLSVAKKSITEFKKLCTNQMLIADLMLFYVETGVKYTLCYGDIDAPFYTSMENMYKNALSFIEKNNFRHIFNVRCQKIVEDTSAIGWGFHDQLSELYDAHVEK